MDTSALQVPEGKDLLHLGLGDLLLHRVLVRKFTSGSCSIEVVLGRSEVVVGLEEGSDEADGADPESTSPKRVDGCPEEETEGRDEERQQPKQLALQRGKRAGRGSTHSYARIAPCRTSESMS